MSHKNFGYRNDLVEPHKKSEKLKYLKLGLEKQLEAQYEVENDILMKLHDYPMWRRLQKQLTHNIRILENMIATCD